MSEAVKLYLLTFPNGKQYVGITSLSIKKRLAFHQRSKRGIVGRAFRRHGHPEVEILDRGPRQKMARQEIEEIQRRGTQAPNGYNLSEGGDGFSSSEMRAFWSDPKFRAKAVAGMKGKSHGDVSPLKAWRERLKSDPKARARYSRKLSERNRRRWAKPGAREEHAEKLRATWRRKRAGR